MRTDSSEIGIGAILSQISHVDKSENIIAYYSNVLQPHEFNYNITTHEALAVLSSIRHFATYLRFTKFLIKTDHIDLKIYLRYKKLNKNPIDLLGGLCICQVLNLSYNSVVEIHLKYV